MRVAIRSSRLARISQSRQYLPIVVVCAMDCARGCARAIQRPIATTHRQQSVSRGMRGYSRHVHFKGIFVPLQGESNRSESASSGDLARLCQRGMTLRVTVVISPYSSCGSLWETRFRCCNDCSSCITTVSPFQTRTASSPKHPTSVPRYCHVFPVRPRARMHVCMGRCRKCRARFNPRSILSSCCRSCRDRISSRPTSSSARRYSLPR